MAKKKVSSTPAKKSAPKKGPTKATKKGTVEATSPKAAAPRKKMPATRTAKAPKPGADGNSVDGVIKKYEKERSTQESQLASLSKKIVGMQKQADSLYQQIEKLSAQRMAAEDAIAQLDTRRDEEITALLAKLGVSVGYVATSVEVVEIIEEVDGEGFDVSDDEDGQIGGDLDELLGGR